MLSDEHKEKLTAAIKVIEDLIKFLDSSPIDPRAITLLDITASYLEEQRENGVEYREDLPPPEDEEDEEPHSSGSIEEITAAASTSKSAEEYRKAMEEVFDGEDEEFKFLSPMKKPPKLEARPLQRLDGDAIAEEIQKWYEAGMPDELPE